MTEEEKEHPEQQGERLVPEGRYIAPPANRDTPSGTPAVADQGVIDKMGKSDNNKPTLDTPPRGNHAGSLIPPPADMPDTVNTQPKTQPEPKKEPAKQDE